MPADGVGRQMFKKSKFSQLIIVLITLANLGECQFPEFELINGTINGTTEGSLNYQKEVVYFFPMKDTMSHLNFEHTSIIIQVTASLNFTRDCPLLVTVRENQGLLSWELPVSHTNKYAETTVYYTAGRTLCIPANNRNNDQTIWVAISSCTETVKSFTLEFWIRDNLIVKLSEEKSVQISPTTPAFHKFKYAPKNMVDFLFIYLDSLEVTCAMISVQHPSCPVLDQENNVQFQGYWQSMTYKAGITIRTKNYPKGFFLVFVVLKEDERCLEYSGIEIRDGGNNLENLKLNGLPRSKIVKFSIHEAISTSGYIVPTLVPLIFIFGLILVTLLTSIGFQHLKHKMVLERTRDSDTQISFVNAPAGQYRTKFQSSLNIADLECIDCEKLTDQSKRYYWLLIIVAIFYCVPVFQLIINYLKVVYRTGEQDICYYNFRCAKPLGYILDFNHIYSNIGYILLGMAFIAFVKLRQVSFYCGREENYELDSSGKFRKVFPLLNSNLEYGVLQHFGLFYALGLALILEGLLSGAYHICPNQSNFQFDTSFMYTIAFLGIVKIFQFRHFVYISADITFISLAFVASSAVMGLLFNNLAFKICFSVVHMGVVIFLLIYLYYFGFVFDDDGNVVTNVMKVFSGIYSQHWENSTFKMPHWSRLILPFLAIFFNMVIVVMIWTVMQDSNFATQILAIFVVNLFVYTTYYVIMKLVHNEYEMKLWIQPGVYLILSAGLWVISLYYFQNALTSWEQSPAESKTQNANCIVYDFYDNHDLWHFLSAGALFCSFMLLLTIDDDLVTRKHDQIAVF